MEEIKYIYDKFCKTPCPHDKGKEIGHKDSPAMIASAYCQQCNNFVSMDSVNKIVTCSYPKEEKVEEIKYKRLQLTISMMSMSNVIGCQDFKNACIDWLNMGYSIRQDICTDDLISVAKEHNGIQCLIDKGFIEKVEPEIFYELGNKFEIDGEVYQIVSIFCNLAFLANIEGQRAFDKSTITEIEDYYKITKAELESMASNRFKDLKKIS